MSVNYDLYETPDLAKSGEEQPLHARVVLKGSYTAEEFVEQVTVFQHMPHAQVVGVIEAISKEARLSWTSGRRRKESLFRKLQKKRNSRFFLCAGRLWIL